MTPDSDLKDRLHKLSSARIVFAALLFGSTLFVQFGRESSPDPASLVILYGLIAAIFILSPVYLLLLKRSRNHLAVAYVQTLGDTFIVTIVLFVTGGFSSLFAFLYLVVIVYSSLLLPRRGTVLIAALCSIQFGLVADLEYFGLITPPYPDAGMLAIVYGWDHVLTKIIAIMVACVVVAFLSSFLSEQTLRTKRELRIMEEHVKRVEKMAAIGEMAAGLAHEIKNPLASLSGAIQMLREDIRYDPDHDRLMQIILREADRLSALASNFLLYARPPAGKPEPIELDKALRETLELFDKKGDAGKRIATTLKAQPGIWTFMDPAHLRQILWNLLMNATEAIEDSGQIQVELTLAKDRQAYLKITDSGIGMAPETLKSIFAPFFTTKPAGTGLGLSIVHRILEAYDCRLDVESEPGQGSTFILRLKQVDAPVRSAG
jgi:two-component system sensor histidine kinase PilS (NtrC family)